MSRGLTIRTDLHTPDDLRRRAKRERVPLTARRMLAIANALSGMSRTEAARAVGMERQFLRDAVVRYNSEGLEGLTDRPKPGRSCKLDEQMSADLRTVILEGPSADTGLCAWTLPALCRVVEARFNQRYTPQGMSLLVRRLGLSKQKTRPQHPGYDEKAQEAFKEGAPRHAQDGW